MHVTLIVLLPTFAWLTRWQLSRALGGNTLSWAYTFEWPIFTVFGVIFWAKTIADEWRSPGGTARQREQLAMVAGPDGQLTLPATAHTPATSDEFDDAEDPELAAYNAYLTGLSSGQQLGRFTGGPGGPQPTAG